MKLTLLKEEQIYGDKALEIIKKNGITAPITDFGILVGGAFNTYSLTNDRMGYYWTNTNDKYNDIRVIRSDGIIYSDYVRTRNNGIRLILELSSVQTFMNITNKIKNDILEVEYGYYPRSVACDDLQYILERTYVNDELNTTGNKYTIDRRKYDEYDKSSLPSSIIEYEYNDKRYVRVKATPYKYNVILSNNKKYEYGDYVWVSVEPLKWLVDKNNSIMITKEIILAGIQFNYKKDYNGDFSKTNIKKFIDKYLLKELFQPRKNYINNNTLTKIKKR